MNQGQGGSAPKKRHSGLGRGLSALLGEVAREEPVAPQPASPRSGGVRMVAVADMKPHPGQPRQHFDEDALSELAGSIAKRGVIQPIVVRPNGAAFQIVAGERRWRAAQRAQLHEVPVIVRDFSESEALEIALIENIQREDLNAIEEAEAYKKLAEEFGHSQEALGRLVNKSRSHVANLLRLLELPVQVRDLVANKSISMGHARALITAPDAEALAAEVMRRDLSVRETEALARSARPAKLVQPHDDDQKDTHENADIEALQRQLGDLLGLKVRISHGPKNGTLTLSYNSLDQLDMICQRLSGEKI